MDLRFIGDMFKCLNYRCDTQDFEFVPQRVGFTLMYIMSPDLWPHIEMAYAVDGVVEVNFSDGLVLVVYSHPCGQAAISLIHEELEILLDYSERECFEVRNMLIEHFQ